MAESTSLGLAPYSRTKVTHNRPKILRRSNEPAAAHELNSVIPDLRTLSLERLAELGDSALAHSIALYRERLKETGVPLSSFNARI